MSGSKPRSTRNRRSLATIAVAIVAAGVATAHAVPGLKPSFTTSLRAPAFAGAVRANAQLPFRLDAARYLAHIRFLASDELRGRAAGTAESERAAEYIAQAFRESGIDPAGEDGTYFQRFEFPPFPQPDGTRPIVITGAGAVTPFRLGTQYHPLSAGEPGSDGTPDARLPLVFAGYGISAPAMGYDDYATLDARAKAVVVFTHEPQENNDRSVFDGRALTPHSNIVEKAMQAARRGARLLVVVEDPSHLSDRALTPGWTTDPQITALPIPVIRVDRTRLARALGGFDFARLARLIDSDLTPRSQVLAGMHIDVAEALPPLHPYARNVVGLVRGSDAACGGRAVVVGAHYDHVGFGWRHSMSPVKAGEIHNGADDNASGTALVIEMARAAAGNRRRFPCSIVFAAFGAEEVGLIGSKHYVSQPSIPIELTIAMINLDMVGRGEGRVMVGGLNRASWLATLIDSLRPLTPLRLTDFSEGYEDGASDDESFRRAGVPTLMFFTGFHDDYHRPADDWPLIDAQAAVEIGNLALAIIERIGAERR